MKAFWIISTALLIGSLTGCKQPVSGESGSKSSKLREFMGKSDLLLKVQRLPIFNLTLPEDKQDKQDGPIKSHWIPGHLSILPITVEEVNKENTEMRGANFTLADDYYVISGYGSPTEGKHSTDQASLDMDELADMQSAITYMQKTETAWRSKNPSDDTIIRFKSKDGLSLALQQDDGTRKIEYLLSIDDTSMIVGDEQIATLSGEISKIIDDLKRR
jgi:hypothetical protein